MLAFSVARDTLVLLFYPVAVGTDGYYYVLQVHGLLNLNCFYFPTSTPLIFYLLAALSALIGDTVLAIKIGSITLHVLLCSGVYALVSAITHNRWLGVLGCGIIAFSAMHFYMIAEFVKNLGALTLMVWSGWSAIYAAQIRQARWIVLSVALLIAAICSHRSVWIIAPALLTLTFLLRWAMIAEGSNRRKLVALFVVLLAASPALTAAQTLVELPAWLGKELLTQPKWPISLRSPIGKVEMFALLLAAPITLLLIKRCQNILTTYPSGFVIGAVALRSLLITLNPFLNHDVRQLGIVGRLDHLMYLQVAILVPGLIWLLRFAYRKAAIAVLTVTPLLIVVSMVSHLPKGLQPQYLSNRAQMIQALPEQRQQLGTTPLIPAQHGDEFVVTWVLGVPARQRLPENTRDRSAHWLLHRVEAPTLTTSMIVVMEEENDSALVLIKNDELSQWLNTLTEAERNRLLTRNTHLKRRFAPSA